jgi:hypothetical protein
LVAQGERIDKREVQSNPAGSRMSAFGRYVEFHITAMNGHSQSPQIRCQFALHPVEPKQQQSANCRNAPLTRRRVSWRSSGLPDTDAGTEKSDDD